MAWTSFNRDVQRRAHGVGKMEASLTAANPIESAAEPRWDEPSADARSDNGAARTCRCSHRRHGIAPPPREGEGTGERGQRARCCFLTQHGARGEVAGHQPLSGRFPLR